MSLLSWLSTSRAKDHSNTLSKKSAIRALFLWTVLFFALAFYGRRNFYRDPLSIFFDPSRAYERKYSALREQQAGDYLKWIKDLSETLPEDSLQTVTKGSADARICACFVTVNREEVQRQYVETSISSLLVNLTSHERNDLHLNILFADPDPTKHPVWNEPWLKLAFDDILTYDSLASNNEISGSSLDHLKQLHEQGNLLNKGIMDYSLALNHCYLTTNSPYIAMFEDDVLVANGWFSRTILGLKEMARLLEKRGQGERKDWGSMRLFNQERSTGWASTKIGDNNELFISLGIGSVIYIFLRLLKEKSRISMVHVDSGAMFVTCCLAVPAFVILFYQAGKASLFPPRPGVYEESFGCCSQGMIFPREHVPSLVGYLRARQTGKYDLITRDWTRINNLTRWALYPVQMQHIGVESSIKAFAESENEAQAVWSMAFESLDSEALEQEHAEMVKKLYD